MADQNDAGPHSGQFPFQPFVGLVTLRSVVARYRRRLPVPTTGSPTVRGLVAQPASRLGNIELVWL